MILDYSKVEFQHTPFALKTERTNKMLRQEANKTSAGSKIKQPFLRTKTRRKREQAADSRAEHSDVVGSYIGLTA